MFLQFSHLKGKKIIATDAEFGRINDALIDERSWQIRYLTVDTQRWLPGNKVVLAPDCFHEPPLTEGLDLKVDLSRREVENAPQLSENLPISKTYQESLHQYYGWNPYWTSAYAPPAGQFPYPVNLFPDRYPLPEQVPSNWQEMRSMYENYLESRNRDEHLHSALEMQSYRIRATDDDFGEVSDIIIDTESWQVIDLVLASHRWLPGSKETLCSSQFVTDVDHVSKFVVIGLDRDAIINAPEFDPNRNDASYRRKLIEYYASGHSSQKSQAQDQTRSDSFQSMGY